MKTSKLLVSALVATTALPADASSRAMPLKGNRKPFHKPSPRLSKELAFLEIHSISLTDPNENLVNSKDNKAKDEFYVSFQHDQDTKAVRSLPLLKTAPTGKTIEATVDLHLDLQGKNKKRPLKCDIYRKRGNGRFFLFGHDEKVGTAEFSPEDLKVRKKLSEQEIQVKAKVKDNDGKPLPVTLGAAVCKKKWLEPYVSELPKQDRMEIFFTLASALLGDAVKNTNNPDASELPIPVKAKDPNLKFTSFMEGDFQFPEEDEFISVARKVKIAMTILNKIPFEDTRTRFKNRAQGMFAIRNRFKTTIMSEPKEGRWENPTSDETMKRVFFSSMGMFFVKKHLGVEGGYVCDMTFMKDYKLREDYADQSCVAYFNDDGYVTKIVDGAGTIYRPGHKYWEWAKLLARTSVFVWMGILHVVEAHYIWGNIPCAGLRMYLSPDHPIRRAFTVHFFKTAYTCCRARYSLSDPAGILARGLSMDYPTGLKKAFQDLLHNFRFSRFPDEMKDKGLDTCDFHVAAQDGCDMHNVLSQYVDELLDEVYDSEDALQYDDEMRDCYEYFQREWKGVPSEFNLHNVKLVWSEILFRVSGWHESIGQVTAYALDPSLCNIRLEDRERTESLVSCEEGALCVGAITAITTVPCPTLGQDWSHAFEDHVPTSYKNLRKNLDQLGKIIEERNTKREFNNVDFHPYYTAISISS